MVVKSYLLLEVGLCLETECLVKYLDVLLDTWMLHNARFRNVVL